MPKVALADTFDDWAGLLRAAAKHKNKRRLYEQLDKLQAAYDRLRELNAQRESLRAQQQRTTQEMREVKDAGKLAAIDVRSILKGIHGHSSEALVQYRMRPIRKRGPRRKAAADPKPTP